MNLILRRAYVDQMHFCKMPPPLGNKVDPSKFTCIGIIFWEGLCKFSAEPSADLPSALWLGCLLPLCDLKLLNLSWGFPGDILSSKRALWLRGLDPKP